ncbi:MAG: cbb3-type cytochrome c oxidase subunit I [Candidatus Hinthialibacter antarcticus]|nr:cbb3-type cytochrome c oxidase subunit I [Candidatus Hinthialibacter antarcticus]
MVTTTLPPSANPSEPVHGDNYITHSKGIMSWLVTLDHKRIAVLYLISILSTFFLGGVFALLVRTELITAGPTMMDANTYNKMFTLHGIIMTFMVIIPGIPAVFGNFALPLMLGAKDVAFPRLNLASWYFYVVGAIFAVIAIVMGGVDTGWTFYTPYSTTTSTAVIPVTVAAFILGFSSIFTGLNFIVTIHMLRPPGMGWFKMPLFLWALYGTALIQVLATPVVGITILLLIIERLLGVGIFDPSLGGDPVLYQHFFWFYSHPAVYIMILPAMGVISELIPTFSRKHIFGYNFIVYSSLAIAILGFLVWGHHMFTSGQSVLASFIFSLLTFSVSIPSAIKVFNWLATMYKGSISLQTPMCYALMFIFIFGIGGLTGLFLATLATDVHLHDTYFVVAHFHYVMVGAMIAFVGAIHYWWPKMFGVMYSDLMGRIAAFLMFVGFNLTFFPQFVMGSHGMPRRYYNYLDVFWIYHFLSTLGSYLMAISFFMVAGYLVHSLFRGKKAPDNPWGAATLDWQTSTPPIHENFKETPTASDPYDYSDWEYDAKIEGFVKKSAAAGSSA